MVKLTQPTGRFASRPAQSREPAFSWVTLAQRARNTSLKKGEGALVGIGVNHANPDYALWYGWSEMRRDLTEIQSLATELREKAKHTAK